MFGHDKTKKISEDKNKDIWKHPSIKRGSSISLKVGHDTNKEDENKDIWYHSTIKSIVGDDEKQLKKYNIDYIKMGRGRGALISVVMM